MFKKIKEFFTGKSAQVETVAPTPVAEYKVETPAVVVPAVVVPAVVVPAKKKPAPKKTPVAKITSNKKPRKPKVTK